MSDDNGFLGLKSLISKGSNIIYIYASKYGLELPHGVYGALQIKRYVRLRAHLQIFADKKCKKVACVQC